MNPALRSDPNAWRQLRTCPVVYDELHDHWIVSRHAEVAAALRDHAAFSSAHGTMLDMMGERPDPKPLIFRDPPEHSALRRAVVEALRPASFAGFDQIVEEVVSQCLDELGDRSSFDFCAEFADRVPVQVAGRIFGVPDERLDELRVWSDQMVEHLSDETAASVMDAAAQLFVFFQGVLADRRIHPGDDVVSALAQLPVDPPVDMSVISELDLCTQLLFMWSASHETLRRLLGAAAVVLARNPEQRELLVRDPTLIPQAIEELLRFVTPGSCGVARYTTKEVVLGAHVIPADARVFLHTASADRDELEFTSGDVFDLRRRDVHHLAFGGGVHFCAGAALARTEARIALTRFLERFPVWNIDESELVTNETSTVRGFVRVPVEVRTVADGEQVEMSTREEQ